MKKEARELLKYIQHYYPIGLPLLYHDYEGIKEIKEIVAQKAGMQFSGNDCIWDKYSDKIKNELPNLQLIDRAYAQFPSYSMELLIDSKNISTNFHYSKSIWIDISLLVNKFTIYFKELVSPIEDGNIINDGYIIAYNTTNTRKDERKYFDILEQSTNFFYPKHTFINHKILFNYKVYGGILYHEKIKENTSIYEYLFSDLSPLHQIKILP